VPPYLQDVKLVKENSIIMANLNRGMSEHLTGSRPSKLLMAKDIAIILAVFENFGSFRQAARALGVDTQNIKKGAEKRLTLDTNGNAFWTTYRRATHDNAISESLRELIVDWWTTKTTILSNRKDVTSKRIGVKLFEHCPTHYLQIPQISSIHYLSYQ
jgi:hypothetical protein